MARHVTRLPFDVLESPECFESIGKGGLLTISGEPGA